MRSETFSIKSTCMFISFWVDKIMPIGNFQIKLFNKAFIQIYFWNESKDWVGI